jgi:hypothetical protein
MGDPAGRGGGCTVHIIGVLTRIITQGWQSRTVNLYTVCLRQIQAEMELRGGEVEQLLLVSLEIQTKIIAWFLYQVPYHLFSLFT